MVVGDRVRLINPHRDLPAGAEGVLVGFYRKPAGDEAAVLIYGSYETIPPDSLQVVPSLHLVEDETISD